MIHAGVTLPSHSNLSPVIKTELQKYCFDALQYLEILSKSALGEIGYCSLENVRTWSGSEEQIALVERSSLWKEVSPAFEYAERGMPLNATEVIIDERLGQVAQWLSATFTFREFNLGIGFWAGEKVMYKFLARLKLDFEWDLEEALIPVLAEWYPQTHAQHLTILEVALLAGMDNVRSVRNATYEKDNPLKTIKEGRSVLVEVSEARRWLLGRRDFVPTQGVNYGKAD